MINYYQLDASMDPGERGVLVGYFILAQGTHVCIRSRFSFKELPENLNVCI